MTELPRGWASGPLSDFVTPRGEKVSPADFPKLPFIGMDHVEAHTTRIVGSVPAREMKSNASRFCRNDVLYGRLRPYLNKVAQPRFDGLASAEFIVFSGNEMIGPGFLRYRLHAQDFVSFAAHLNEGDRPRVSFEQIGDFEVLVPPANEQRRIVQRIEALFDEIDRGVESLRDAKRTIGLYRQSLLKAAFEGRLTADWRAKNPDKLESHENLIARAEYERGEWYRIAFGKWTEEVEAWQSGGAQGPKPRRPEGNSRSAALTSEERAVLPRIPKSWVFLRLSDIAAVGSGMSVSKARKPEVPVDVPYLRVANVQRGFLDLGEIKTMQIEVSQAASLGLRPWDTPRVIVECKSHTWTSGGNVPSAKMKNWAEAMFYFHMAPGDYRKIFFVERSVRRGRSESLLSYFLRTQAHMIPSDVECWELDGDELVVHEVPS